mmetsp:Transcript_27421/g.52220  ORF Transcript_27421/g.52220 Transcript_27421/m.52220 type:complete len:394 (-) Transcript_27421:377-1558(-)
MSSKQRWLHQTALFHEQPESELLLMTSAYVGGGGRRAFPRGCEWGDASSFWFGGLLEQFLHARHDVFAISVLFQRWKVVLHSSQQELLLLLRAHLKHLLNDVVCILILHHRLQGIRLLRLPKHLVDDELPTLWPAKLKATFNHVGGKLVLTHQHNLSRQLGYYLQALRQRAVLEHVLNDVVPVLVLRQLARCPEDLGHDAALLLGQSAVLQHALNHAAPVGVRGQLQHVAEKRRHHKCQVLRSHSLDALLDDVVAVLVAHAPLHVPVQLLNELQLLGLLYHLQRLLHYAAAVHLQTQRQHVALELLREHPPLRGGAMLEKLLDHVVAKHVRHQRQRARENLNKHQRRLFLGRRLQTLLDEARAVLVHGELHHVPHDVWELEPPRLVGLEVVQQ